MFAKGPQPGYSPKTEYLQFNPDAICKQHRYATHMAYAVYRTCEDDRPLLIRPTARDAWEAALNYHLTHKGIKAGTKE